jgi:glycosyltransferase 2 family protein
VTGKGNRRLWWWPVSILVSGVLLYYSLRGVDWARVWRTIAAADRLFLAVSAVMMSFSYFMRSVRWRVLLNAEAGLGVMTVFWANMAGYLGNNFLPARAGEVLRSMLISNRSRLSRTYVLTTALAERLMDVIALVLCGSLIILRFDTKPGWMAGLSRSMAIAAGFGALAIAVLPHTGSLLKKALPRIPLPEAIHNRLAGLVQQVLLGLRAFHDWRRCGTFTLLTAAIWLCDAGSTIVGARALGVPLSLPGALLLLSGLGLGSGLPSTPGYVGVYQFVAVTTLAPFGIGRDRALAFILVTQAMGYVVVLAYGLPGLALSRQKSIPSPV